MAGAIKGITIEFDGNTTKLSKAIGDVNKESKSLQQELRGINSLLKMDPSSTELLSQKQKVLAESISTTKKKLETLKSVQEQVNEQFEKGDIGEKEYRDFQREIEATEQKLKSLTSEMKEFGSVSAQKIAAAGEKVKDVGGKIESAGKAMMPVTAAVVGLGTASVAAFKNLDEGYDTIVTATGATGDALEGLKQSANDVYSSMNISMSEVGGAIGEVNTRFGATDDKLTGMTSTFLKFAKITGQDVVTAVGNADKIMEAWNIKAEDCDKLLGLIAGKAQETGISVDTLENSLMKNGSTFKEMGLSIEQSIELLAQFERSGVDSSTAITGLRKAVQNATKDGLSADEAIKQTIESIKSASTETEALSIASELFGTKGAAEMTRAIREGRFSLDELNTSMNDYQNTVSDTYEATQDPVDKMQIALNNLKLAGSEMGKTILEVLNPAIEKMADMIKNAAEKLSSMPESAKKLIVVAGGITAAIGPVLIVVGKLVGSIGSIMQLAPKIQGAFSGIAAAVGGLSAPVLAIIAAISMIVAAFVYLIKTNDEFREKIIGVFSDIKEKFSKLGGKIVESLNSLGFNFSSFSDAVKGIWDRLCNNFAPVFEAVFGEIGTILTSACDILIGIIDVFTGLFTGNWSQMWEGVKGIFGGVWEFISQTALNYVTLLEGLYGTFFDIIGTVWSAAWNNIKDFTGNVWNDITTTVTEAWNGIVSFFTQGIPNFFAKVKEWFAQLPYNISYALGLAIGKVAQWVVDMVDKAHEMGSNFIAKVIEFFTQLPVKISEFVKNALNHIITFAKEAPVKAKEMATNFLKNVVNTIKELPGKIQNYLKESVSKAATWVKDMGSKGKEAITSLIANIVEAAKSIPSNMMEIGKNIVQGVWNGILNAKNWFVGKVKDFFGGIVDGVKDALGIHSPSTVFATKVGRWIPAGIGQGITDNAKSALAPLQKLFDDIIGSTPNMPIDVTSGGDKSQSTESYTGALAKIMSKLDELGNIDIYLDGKKLVGSIIKDIDSGLSDIARQKARGM